ncbi:hypothetical protein H310_00325 [Aphanomyces invadans]|uniref:Cytochrome b561 domain-containing protein n=1 Tax=Aphanomyces invadans TaxID=157072 RepID=A0A024UU54_9STRA|nr:hypothetical protein H310_00325 [Aphanomyces invadans]ETW09879.1 hypothetical protein H310_00325 [Aphanomyces invadans]|eukprot:XP_008861290.1 hypothetical protein H310_00325 [Aphanomyces invadans]
MPHCEASSVRPDPESTPCRAWYDGNFTIWWLIGALLGLWFTLYKGLGIVVGLLPPSNGIPVGPVFAMHLVTSILFMCICIFNVFHTPSHGRVYRKVHRLLGCMAMISGVISFITGAVAVWWERYTEDLGFSIGITVGGVLQMGCQGYGWYKIRQGNVGAHKTVMLATFYYSCLIPLWLRIVGIIVGRQDLPFWVQPAALAVGLVFGQLGIRAALANRIV